MTAGRGVAFAAALAVAVAGALLAQDNAVRLPSTDAHYGPVKDYVEAEPGYERAVEACLGDLLQYVVVDRRDQADTGLSMVRAHHAGRCGFVVVGEEPVAPRVVYPPLGAAVPLAQVLRVLGPHADVLARVLPEAYITTSLEDARSAARRTPAPVATLDGDVVRGTHLIMGGARAEARGILSTRREIKELRGRLDVEREALVRMAGQVVDVERTIAESTAALAALGEAQHAHEKTLVAVDAQLARASRSEEHTF